MVVASVIAMPAVQDMLAAGATDVGDMAAICYLLYLGLLHYTSRVPNSGILVIGQTGYIWRSDTFLERKL